jgi:hypothetical protein
MYVGRETNYPGKEEHVPPAPFYSPLLADAYCPERRSYAVLSWGQIPTPSIHRSGALFAAQFRDLGTGAIEVTYVCFNFADDPITSLDTPWGGVRTSVFPELVLAGKTGAYQFHTPYSGDMRGYYSDIKDTGGWAAGTQNAADPHAFALGLVFGNDQHWAEQSAMEKTNPARFQRTPSIYGAGDSRHGPRDYTAMVVGNRPNLRPGETYYRRVYFLIGTLSEVAEKAKTLEPLADYGRLAFAETDTLLLPLHARKMPNGQIIPTVEVPDQAGDPLCCTYAYPVEGSKPLFLLQEANSGRYAVSADPYLFCTRVAFENPYPQGEPKHTGFENRVQYLTYDGKTRWLGILGYAMPLAKADSKRHRYAAIATVPALAELFQPGESAKADALLVRTTNNPK